MDMFEVKLGRGCLSTKYVFAESKTEILKNIEIIENNSVFHGGVQIKKIVSESDIIQITALKQESKEQ